MKQQPCASAIDCIVCRNSKDVVKTEEELTQVQVTITFAPLYCSSHLTCFHVSCIVSPRHPQYIFNTAARVILRNQATPKPPVTPHFSQNGPWGPEGAPSYYFFELIIPPPHAPRIIPIQTVPSVSQNCQSLILRPLYRLPLPGTPLSDTYRANYLTLDSSQMSPSQWNIGLTTLFKVFSLLSSFMFL